MLDMVGIANRLTDMDWGWWPFLYLRPPPEERMSVQRVALMSVHFGPVTGLILGGLVLLRHPSLRDSMPRVLIGAVAVCTIVYFAVYLVTFAYCWNLRAARLAASSEGRPVPAVATRGLHPVATAGLIVVFLAIVGSALALAALVGFETGRAARARPDDEWEAATAQAHAEAERWAPTHTQSECIAEGMRRDALCRDVACKVPIVGFMEVCFVRARPTAGLCDGVRPPADDAEDLRWREGRCQLTHPQALRQCVQFIPLLQGHCATHTGVSGQGR